MSDKKVKILIADDHKILIQGLKKILLEDFKNAEIGEAANADEVFDKIKENKWSILLLDISMPGRSGLEVIAELKYKEPNLPILVLSMYAEEQFALRALKSGASGYLRKDSAYEELVTAVNKILNGGVYISHSVEDLITETILNPNFEQLHNSLSNREYEIFLMLANGKSVTEISDDLSISVKTVSTHRANILEKMKLKNNSELTLYAARHKLIE